MESENLLSSFETNVRPDIASHEELSAEALRRMNVLGISPYIQASYTKDGTISITRQPVFGISYIDTLTPEEMQLAQIITDEFTYNLLFEGTVTKASGIIYYALQANTGLGNMYAFLSVGTDKAQWAGASFGDQTVQEGADLVRYIEALSWTVPSNDPDADITSDGFSEVGIIGVCTQNGILVRRG